MCFWWWQAASSSYRVLKANKGMILNDFLSTLFRNVPSLVDWFYALVLILILGSI